MFWQGGSRHQRPLKTTKDDFGDGEKGRKHEETREKTRKIEDLGLETTKILEKKVENTRKHEESRGLQLRNR